MYRLIVCLVVVAACAACGGESGEDPSAGTGILGGNPLTIAFESEEPDSEPGALDGVLDIQIHYGLVRFGYPDDDGACLLEDEFAPYEDTVTPGDRTSIEVDEDVYPCAMNVRPPPGTPLVTASIDAGIKTVDVALSEETGFILDLDPIEAAEDENPEVVAILTVEQVLTGFDVSALLMLVGDSVTDGTSVGDDLLAAIEGAVVVYRDPTPGDGELVGSERVDGNLSGSFRFE
jgi:hypothetical protein